jgi:hypothetical protein
MPEPTADEPEAPAGPPRCWWDPNDGRPGFYYRDPDDDCYWYVGTNGDTGRDFELPEDAVELAPVARLTAVADAARCVRDIYPFGHIWPEWSALGVALEALDGGGE